MEWLNELQGKIIGLDTAPLIYFIEENPSYLAGGFHFLNSSRRKSETFTIIRSFFR
jgi:hypothetical protein